jgi:hypothetical protein
VRFDFWGRHLAIFFPGLVLALIQVTSEVGERTRIRTAERVAFMLLVVAWAISDARIVGNPQYYKDDYRFAATFALDEAGRTGSTVLWAADTIGGRYYGIELGQPKPDVVWPVRGKGLFVANWTDGQINEYMASRKGAGQTILVLSKADLYDSRGAWAAAVERMNARKIASANSFDIYAFKCGEPNQALSETLHP